MSDPKQEPSLDRPATYQIKVPGLIDLSGTDWASRLKVAFESEGPGPPMTILTGHLDQAALHGLLTWLYSMGLPLGSVVCAKCDTWEEE